MKPTSHVQMSTPKLYKSASSKSPRKLSANVPTGRKLAMGLSLTKEQLQFVTPSPPTNRKPIKFKSLPSIQSKLKAKTQTPKLRLSNQVSKIPKVTNQSLGEPEKLAAKGDNKILKTGENNDLKENNLCSPNQKQKGSGDTSNRKFSQLQQKTTLTDLIIPSLQVPAVPPSLINSTSFGPISETAGSSARTDATMTIKTLNGDYKTDHDSRPRPLNVGTTDQNKSAPVKMPTQPAQNLLSYLIDAPMNDFSDILDYFFTSPNGKNLPEESKSIVSEESFKTLSGFSDSWRPWKNALRPRSLKSRIPTSKGAGDKGKRATRTKDTSLLPPRLASNRPADTQISSIPHPGKTKIVVINWVPCLLDYFLLLAYTVLIIYLSGFIYENLNVVRRVFQMFVRDQIF